jgi:hypothetical protein
MLETNIDENVNLSYLPDSFSRSNIPKFASHVSRTGQDRFAIWTP